ncbi:MAG: hypothetical protein PHS14_19885, partial [Elusimicrobia bacterium]|nr:hypothetical protein [Elusimicrobiota bacterium]
AKWIGPEGTLPVAIQPFKLDSKALVERWGPEILGRLAKAVPPIYAAEGGVHPELAAGVFGFPDGDTMVRALMAASSRSVAVKEAARQEMKRLMGDEWSDTGKRAEAALEAAHTDSRAALLAGHLRALTRKAGLGAPMPLEALQAAAQRIIAAKSVKDAVAVLRYHAAELRAAKAAGRAIAKGDWVEAAEQKRRQLLNHFLVREASAAKDAAAKMTRHFSTYRNKQGRARYETETLRQVLGILDRIGFGVGILPEQFEGDKLPLAKWLQEREAEEIEIPVSDWLLNEGNRAEWDALPWAEALAARDLIAAMEKQDPKQRKLFTTGENLEAARLRLAGEIARATKAPVKRSTHLAPGALDRLREGIGKRVAELTRMEFLFRRLGGFEVANEVHAMLFAPFAAAENREQEMRGEAAQRLHELQKAHFGTMERSLWWRRTMVEGAGFDVSKAEALALGLNWGNADNRLAVAKGWGTQFGLGLEDANERAEKILATLTESDWQYIQGVWELIDGYWPEIRKLNLDVVGVAPKKVNASPVVIGGRVVARGGYYPLKYDRSTSERAEKYAEKGDVSRLFESSASHATTAQGHTKARVGSAGMTVRLELGVLAEHLDQVIHDLTHRRAVIDVDRLISGAEVEEAIVSAVGRPLYRQIRPWLHALANSQTDDVLGWERWILKARHGMTVATLGFSVTTALSQLTSWPVAVSALGPKYAALGLARFAEGVTRSAAGGKRNPLRFALESSPQLRSRMTSFDRDIREMTHGDAFAGIKPRIMQAAFFTAGLLDMAVAVPTWLGAYERAMKERGGDHDAAAEYADSMVRTTQGAGAVKDLPQVMRKPGMMKLFTFFFSYFSNLGNQFLEQTNQTQAEGFGKSLPRLAAFSVFAVALPALLGELAVGRGPDDEDDESWTAWAAKTLGLYVVAPVPMVRDVGRGVAEYWSGYAKGESPLQAGRRAVASIPITRVADAMIGAAGALPWVLSDDPPEGVRREWLKDVVDTAGYWGALPSRQTWITGSAFFDWMAGDIEGPLENPAEFTLRRTRR